MKTIKLLFLAFVLVALVPSAFAQTATVRTALAAAVTDTSGTIVSVLSATGMTASTTSGGSFIFIDQEQMRVRSISGTALTVIRGVGGRASTHLNNATVWFGLPATYNAATGNTGIGVFVAVDPVGRCTRASNDFLPVINPHNANIFDCIVGPSATTGVTTQATTSQWTAISYVPLSNVLPYKKLRPEQNTYTALPTDEIIGVNTNVATTITLPALTGAIGKTYTIQLEVTGAQSVTIATSANQTINGAASIAFGGGGWATSPGQTSFNGITIYSDGTNWWAPRCCN